MKLNSLFFLIIGMIIISACKENEDVLLLTQEELSTFRSKESKISKLYEGYDHGKVASNFVDTVLDLDQSLLCLRKEVNGLPLKTKYYFKDSDSTVELIVYEWNLVTPEMDIKQADSLMQVNLKFHQQYVDKYNELAARIENEIGAPDEGDGILYKKTFQNLEKHYSEYKWKDGSRRVELAISLIPTLSYRVFLKVYWQ